MKALSIYKTEKNYKIITMYLKDTGTYILKDPIFFLDLDVDAVKLGEIIFESLNKSRKITSSEDNFSSKELLKKLKESSFKKLYQNSTSCCIYLEKNLITIEPQICINPNEGLEVVEEDIIQLEYSAQSTCLIVENIIDILNKKY
jgi:hypothetical protein